MEGCLPIGRAANTSLSSAPNQPNQEMNGRQRWQLLGEKLFRELISQQVLNAQTYILFSEGSWIWFS